MSPVSKAPITAKNSASINQPQQPQVAPAAQAAPTTQIPAANGKTNVIAILSLIFAFLLPLVGFILAIIALVQLNKHPEEKGKGLAIAGLIISIVWSLFFLSFIGALAYFGVMSPDSFIPSKCVMPAGLDCMDYRATADGTVDLKIINNMGSALSSVTVSMGAECTPQNVPMSSGAIQVFNCRIPPGRAGDNFKSSINVRYLRGSDSLEKSAVGEFYSRYE